MSTTSIATKQGRHVAALTHDADRLEYLAERGRVVRIIPGRHVACAAVSYQAGQVVDADTHEPLTGALPISDARAIVVAPTGVGRRVRVEAVAR